MKLLAVLDRSRAISGELLDFKMAEEAMAAANRAGTNVGGLDLALLTPGEPDSVGPSGERPVAREPWQSLPNTTETPKRPLRPQN